MCDILEPLQTIIINIFAMFDCLAASSWVDGNFADLDVTTDMIDLRQIFGKPGSCRCEPEFKWHSSLKRSNFI